MIKNLTVLLLAAAVGLTACSDDAPEYAEAGDAGVDVAPDVAPPDVYEDDAFVPPDIPTIEEDVEEFIPACGLEDDLAPNQGPQEASPIATDFDRQDLFLCGGTSDWYRFDVQVGQELVVALDFDPEFADLDLLVFFDGNRVAESVETDDVERIRRTVQVDGTLFLEVAGRLGGDVEYDLSVKIGCRSDADCPDGRLCSLRERYCEAPTEPLCGIDEGFEPNESTSTATPIVFESGAAALAGLHICSSDEDYYRLDLAAGQGVEIDIVHPRGAVVEALLFGDDGVFRARGTGGNEQRLFAPHLGAGTFYLVLGQPPGDGAVPTTYRMELALIDGGCTRDRDCDGLPAREFCDLETGVCRGVEGEGTVEFGGSCDDSADCVEDLEGCYVGSDGGGDNVCTITCQRGIDCARFGDDAYCVPLDFRGGGVCVPGCTEDSQCSVQFRCDVEAVRCVSRDCGSDVDCVDPAEDCVILDDFGGLCLEYDRFQAHTCGVGRGPDAGENGSSSRGALLELVDGAYEAAGLQTCLPDNDWYTVELTGDATDLAVVVEYQRPAFLNVLVYDEVGTLVGALLDDGVPARVTAAYLPAGRYFISINQYPIQEGLDATSYSLSLTAAPSDCRVAEGSCNTIYPLRISCSDATGACDALQGDGAVPLGDLCDSDSDCVEEAEFCWTRQGGDGGVNICTRRCSNAEQCADVPGTGCVVLGGRFGICLPEGE